jgi:hypothetical protein
MSPPSIAVFIPAYNCAAWAAAVQLPAGVEYYAVDNASTDGTAEVLVARGVTVFRNPENCGRLGNWQRCLELFLSETRADWLQWLFAGDSLDATASDILRRAITDAPTARLIICQYAEVDGLAHHRNALYPHHRLFSPTEALHAAARIGNWFGSPIGHCFHREAVAFVLPVGHLPWVADMELCLRAARHFPVAYRAAGIGCFNITSRQYYTAFGQSLESVYEEGLMRMQAARWWLALTGDTAGFQCLQDHIRRASLQGLVRRGLRLPAPDRLLWRMVRDMVVLKSYAGVVKAVVKARLQAFRIERHTQNATHSQAKRI